MKPNYLFMLLGYPGSGKTYFSERLATKIGAVRVNADAMRVAAFGTIEAAKAFDAKTKLLNPIVFGVLDYTAGQVLKSGNSVICDYQHTRRSARDTKYTIAKENGAIPVVIWVQAPRNLAVRRGSERDESLDHRKHSVEKMEALVERTSSALETPGDDERVIRIDGTVPFEEQYSSFMRQLEKL